jgi:YD repeat-containing protein
MSADRIRRNMKMFPCHIQEAIDAGALSPDPFVIRRKSGKLYVFRGAVVRVEYDDDGLVTRRTTTLAGRHDRDARGQPHVLSSRVIEEHWEPGLPEMGLIPLPPCCALEAQAAGAKRSRSKRGRDAADTKKRLQQALGGYKRRRKSDEK